MRTIRFIIHLTICISLIWALNRTWGKVPPLGKFLNPFEGFWQNAAYKNTHSNILEEIKLKGLKGDAKVLIDENQVPHIFTDNDYDLYFLQAYFTAKDRLWQMDFQTMASAGRLSEILGQDSLILQYDRGQRRKGMCYAAELATEAFMDHEATREMLQAYTDGANAYIENLPHRNFPIEYKILDYRPEPWTPLKSALLLKYMAQNLCASNADLENTNALVKLGKKKFDLLFPLMESGQRPIVDQPNSWGEALPQQALAAQNTTIDFPLDPGPNPLNGSNNWAVHGSKTKSGKPILCNDPHLGLNLPSIWYAMQLHSPNVNVMGASLPGAPGIIIGMNEKIAWGVTNAQRDLVDWYKIHFLDDLRNRYDLNGKVETVTNRIETIKIKNAPAFIDTVKYTVFGPVYYDQAYRSNSPYTGYAYHWIAHEKSNEVLAFHQINRAENYTAFKQAISHYDAPAQNFAYADIDNNIAMHIQGKFPIRRDEAGRFLREGNHLNNLWEGYIPANQQIYEHNPKKGFIYSANQHPVDETYPYVVAAKRFEYYRNRIIFERLNANDEWTVEDMKKLQNDNFNLQAAESLPHWLGFVDTLPLPRLHRYAYKQLSQWDYENNADTEAPTFYATWWKTLDRMLYEDFDQSEAPMMRPTAYTTIKLLKDPTHQLKFGSKRMTGTELLNLAFVEAMNTLAQEQIKGTDLHWAKFKNTSLRHLARIAPFGAKANIAGNAGSINAASADHGPSWRMIIELSAEGNQMWYTYPGGTSGNPGSPYYNNQTTGWVKGAYLKSPFFSTAPSSSSDQQLLINIQAKN
ncbi:penicillin acylase family protein [Persicobacter psychrovividus]|uniref:Beta-lactam antibiotic acylase n=1 Tax=Persicobacter psychrovividus TaxID=387638 RepID=A0ABM7VC87_9BACT|nr:beta-lactam antibiotic acylase [Persicobacter psychrovividus]